MKTYFIVTGSVTYALRGRDVLKNAGYRVKTERISNKYANSGCGHGIVVSGNIEQILMLLKSKSIKVLRTEVLKNDIF
ncbi:MAG: putative Se/S carrier-like protein [Oscillospiraceae bacterium]